MVEDRKVDYVNSKRLDKPMVALEIIRDWRAQKPPGRFLKLDEKTGLWHDVGDKKAREKSKWHTWCLGGLILSQLQLLLLLLLLWQFACLLDTVAG
jgi:hypothetical protein